MKQSKMILTIPTLLGLLTIISILSISNSTLSQFPDKGPHIAILKSNDTGWTTFDASTKDARFGHIPHVDRLTRESVMCV